MDKTTLQAAMNNVGQEVITRKKEKNDTLLSLSKEQYKNWLFGLIISSVPLFSLPLYQAFSGDFSLKQFTFLLFGSCEIIFIGVSSAITSLNDYIKWDSKKHKSGKVRWNLLLITVGAFVYGIMTICRSFSENFNDLLACCFNIAFLVIIMILGSAEYIQQIQEAK